MKNFTPRVQFVFSGLAFLASLFAGTGIAEAALPCSAANTVSTLKVFGDQKTQIFDSKSGQVVEVVPEFTKDMGDFTQPSLTVKADISPATPGCQLSSKIKVLLTILGEERKHGEKPSPKSKPSWRVIGTQEKEATTLGDLHTLSFEKIPFEAALKALPEDIVFDKIKIQLALQTENQKPVITTEKVLQAFVEHDEK